MARKPNAARGKTTRIGRMKKIAKQLRERAKSKTGMNMSPGAMGGRTKTMTGKAVKGAASGMSGAGLMAMARKLGPTGKLNAAKLERLKKMMGKKSGGKMVTPEQLRKLMSTQPFRKPTIKPGMKPVLDSKGNVVKNLFQKDDRKRPPKRGLRRYARQPKK